MQANAYLTPPGAAGLAPHHDTHDVFVLQVAGTKHWTVREPVVDTPLPRHVSDHDAAAGQPVLFEAVMEPGDTLYLPRGFVHSAAAQQGVSLHLTIGVLATTVHDVLRLLVDRAGDEVAFRRSLPPGWPDDTDAADRGGEVRGGRPRRLAGHGRRRRDVADALSDRFVSNRTPAARRSAPRGRRPRRPRRRHASSCGGPATVTALRLDEPDRLRLLLGDRVVVLPAPVEPAVRRLLDGAARPVGDLADMLDGPSRLVLVRRLVREGALRTAPPDG